MAAGANDYFTKVGLPGNATFLTAPGHATGGTPGAISFNVDSTSLWSTDTAVIFAIDTVSIVGGVATRDTGSYTVWRGLVTSATAITSCTLMYGTDQPYTAGATTRVYILPTSSRENRFVDGMLIDHLETGRHGDSVHNSVSTNTISEKTAASGVTIDSVLLKDGLVQVNGVAQQMVSTNLGTVATGTTLIPWDDTVPQNTEGTEILTQAITPKFSTSKLLIQATVVGGSSASNHLIVALFQDSTAGALAANATYMATVGGMAQVNIRHVMTSGTTSATTFKLRLGQESAGTWTLNGVNAGQRFNLITLSNISITEFKA